MSDDAIETYNVKGLEQLLKALKAKPPVARVGIIGDNNARRDGPTNAEVGAAHEFGTSKLPQRSFLRVPVSENLEKEMESAQLFDKDALAEVLKQGSVIPWMNRVAISAEACIADAFNTGGNGKWPAWKNPDYTNNAGQLLVDTTQLRNSILSDVEGDIRKRFNG